MATERYFVGPRLLTDIRDTISRVQGMPDRQSGGFLPGMYIPLTPPGEGEAMKLGKTVSAWNKGTNHNVQLWPSGVLSDPVQSQVATNRFANVASGKWVMIGKEAGGDWYLIAAEC